MEAQQDAWATQLTATDCHDRATLSVVGGLDTHWITEDEGVAALVVLSWPHLELLHNTFQHFLPTIPYKAGFLGFRECEAYTLLFNRVRGTSLEPQLLFVDGCGVLHPRSCGSASQLGLMLDIPTIGISKTLNSRSKLSDKQVKDNMLATNSLQLPILDHAGLVVGCAVRKSLEHRQPVYVSCGHKISLDTAVELAKTSCLFKIPEPVRQADKLARQQAGGWQACCAPD
jgi:deoxyinosine 3'endonuclease (endonuclease V)